MPLSAKEKKQAKKLTQLSCHRSGCPDPARVHIVLRACTIFRPAERLRLLKLYQHLVRKREKEHQALIESPVPLPLVACQQLINSLEKRYNRPLKTRVLICPSLLAGIRARVGDDVHEISVQSRLHAFSQLSFSA